MALKWVTFGLGLEDCRDPDDERLSSPFALPDAEGRRREPFGYAPFVPYGPKVLSPAPSPPSLAAQGRGWVAHHQCRAGLRQGCALIISFTKNSWRRLFFFLL